ncbi:hypothetical protein EVAR_82037_1 [Eumeta japonica]|uniref:Uncharacterized protein n=1 Tax=Eumeta variegata TaxID=151549 RepID=A0A4C1XN46_EUMVA|nr:hypothetical protein EVAR_82037_1 [Eumeta japonica]
MRKQRVCMTSLAHVPPVPASIRDEYNMAAHSTSDPSRRSGKIEANESPPHRSELSANDAMRRFNAPRPYPLLRRVPISLHCDAFVTKFTAAEFHAL